MLVALILSACGPADSDVASGPLPVITPADLWQDRPLAGVSGVLTMRDNCLLLGGDIVFWLYGTRWDEEREAVVFDDDSAVAVGEEFDGGGGYSDLRGDVSGPLDVESWLGEDAGAAIRECSEKTGITGLVFAYPST
jgi:hypothetical protein